MNKQIIKAIIGANRQSGTDATDARLPEQLLLTLTNITYV